MVRAKLASYAARALEDNSADASTRDPPAEVAEVTRPVMSSRRVQPLQPETRRARRGDARRFAARQDGVCPRPRIARRVLRTSSMGAEVFYSSIRTTL